MTGRIGVADRAGRASPEPQSTQGLGHSATIPCAVYVIVRSIGEYSDRYETPICAFLDEQAAQYFVAHAGREWAAAVHEYPRIDYRDYGDDDDEAAYERAVDERVAKAQARLTLDPGAITDNYDDQPSYFYSRVTLYASAIEAPSGGETAKTGSTEGESAGPKDDAQ